MTYERKEKVEDLQGLITRYNKKRQDRYEDFQVLDEDLLWDAGRFWAIVLHKSNAAPSLKTREKFDQFVQQYNQTVTEPVNPDELFNRHWLRGVMEQIHLARSISSATGDFKRISQWKNELQFVVEFYEGLSKRQSLRVPLAAVETALAIYEAQKGVTLSYDGVYFEKWARKTDDQVEFSAMDVYFVPFLKYWNDFEFLLQWEECSNGSDEKCLTISKDAFQGIWTTFNHFTQLPDMAVLEAGRIIKPEGNDYHLQFNNTERPYWLTLQNKIGGYHWELLVNDMEFVNDKERVTLWLKKNLLGNRWPDHLLCVTGSARKRFLDASLQLLLEQEDLKGCETEVAKLHLDSREYRGAEVLYSRHAGPSSQFRLNDQNLFELFSSMDQLEDTAHITYLHDQPARHWLTFLVTTIVRHDEEWAHSDKQTSSPDHLPRVRRLLREGIEKPFFVWKVCEAIRYQRSGILPFLFLEPDTCTLALSVLDKLELHSEIASIQHQCWVKALDLILGCLPSFENNKDVYTEVVFQVFRQLMAEKYETRRSRLGIQQELERKQQRKEREMAVLDLIENAPVHGAAVYGGQTSLILAELFLPLAEKFVSFDEPSLYRNGTIRFPMLKWDALFWLMKITTNWKMRQHFFSHPEKMGKLVEGFLSQYLESLERKEVETYDFWEEKETRRTPLWSEKIDRLELLDWLYPIYFINERGKLLTFLFPRLDFEIASDRYHKENNFTAEKLRTHIGVLLQILRKLVLPSLPYGFEKEKLLQIKERIEMQIVDYLNRHSKDVPMEGRVDLFSYTKENEMLRSENEALLPQLAQAVNWFSKKEEVINALVATGDIVKLLTVLDYITTEGVKTILLEQIRATDIVTFLNQQTWIPEIQTILSKLSHYPELLPQIEQSIEFWKEKVVGSREDRQHKERCFISELLVAYFKGDEKAINATEEPGEFQGSTSELSYAAYKTFYRGLLYIKDDPEKSVKIFTDLARRYPKYGSIALNRMVAKLNLAAQKKAPSVYREAYDEWKESASLHFSQAELNTMEPDLSANLMTILLALGEHEEIGNRFNKLELPEKMTEHVLKVRVHSLLEQKRTAEALLQVDTARTYHQFSGHTAIAFIKELEEAVSGEDNLKELSVYSQLIFASPPAKLVRILPRSFNGKEDIYEFLIKEIVHAADKMLEKIRSINEIRSEDKFNDLIELVLDSRINGLGMHVGAQSRGGYSDAANDSNTKQPGERDLPIMDRNKKIWLVCEALIYRGKSTAVSHLKKVFDYYHQKHAFVMLFYDKPESKDEFDNDWEKYVKEILPGTEFPKGMGITSALEEVSSDYDCDRSAIKVGRTVHGDGTFVYHIFVNINYKLTKMVK